MEIFLGLFGGLIFGGFVVWLLLRPAQLQLAERLASREAQLSELDARRAQAEADTRQLATAHAQLQQDRAALQATNAQLQQLLTTRQQDLVVALETRRAQDLELRQAAAANGELREAQATLATRLQDLEQSHVEKLALLDDARKQLTDAFQALSLEALRNNNQSFLQLATNTLEERQKAVSEIIKPLREQLQNLEASRIGAYAELSNQVRSLTEQSELLKRETVTLSRALKSSNVRGTWGELQLRRVVELAGMLPYCDFVEQQHTDAGRPDMIIRLPGDVQIVVDAKAPLNAYLEALEATGDARKSALLILHAKQVRDHVKRLSEKAYWQQFDRSPEFVIAFLPGEVFYSTALEQDPSLLEQSVEKRVLLATPTTLIALLKAVAFGWRQERMAREAQQVADIGAELHDRLSKFVAHFDDLRSSLDGAVKAYNRAMGSMESRVLVSARKLRELGAAGTQPELPFIDPIDTQPRRPPGSD